MIINTEVIAWLKLEDNLTDRIINLRHDEHLYEDSIEIVFEVDEKLTKFMFFSWCKSSFFVEDVEFRLDSVDFENNSCFND